MGTIDKVRRALAWGAPALGEVVLVVAVVVTMAVALLGLLAIGPE